MINELAEEHHQTPTNIHAEPLHIQPKHLFPNFNNFLTYISCPFGLLFFWVSYLLYKLWWEITSMSRICFA